MVISLFWTKNLFLI